MASIHRLRDSQLRGTEKATLNDGGGLYFQRENANSAHWFFRTQRRGLPPKTGLGPYPAVPLERARKLAKDCQEAAAMGRSPREVMAEVRGTSAKSLTFADAAKATYESKRRGFRGKNQSGEWFRILEMHTFPKLGKLRCRDISVSDVVSVLKPLWYDQYPTAKKVRPRIKAVLKYAAAADAAVDVELTDKAATQLGKSGHKPKPHAALGWQDGPKLFKNIPESDIRLVALKFYLLTLPRMAPVRLMRWGEITADAWVIPPENMKGGEQFIVPLSTASQIQLEYARSLTKAHDADDLVFPYAGSFKRGIISENFFNNWLKSNNFPSTGHGLRATFRTWATETESCSRDVAELALDHNIHGDVESRYVRGSQFRQRLDAMEKWGTYLSGGMDADTPFLVRTDDEGQDWSLSLNDLKDFREYAEKIEEKDREADWNSDPKNVADWFRHTQLADGKE